MGPKEHSWVKITGPEEWVDCMSHKQSSKNTVPLAKFLISNEYQGSPGQVPAVWSFFFFLKFSLSWAEQEALITCKVGAGVS